MAGTEIYDVCIVFNVYANNDDEALDTVKDYLPTGTWPIAWSWIYTTKENKGEASE